MLGAKGMWSAKAAGSRGFQYGYAYDESSNRIQEFVNGGLIRYEVGENNELLSAGVYEFEYDHFGNTVKQTNTDTAEELDFTYDFESHLVQGKVNGTLKDEFVYNGAGQRTGYRFNAQTDMYHFAHCEVTGNLLCQYWFLGGVYNAIHVNTWGDYGLVCFRSGGTTKNLHFDGLGSTWAVTDTSQNVTDTYSYSAFGIQQASTGSTVNPYRFVGQWGYYDDGAMGSPFGLMLLDSRHYSPTFAKFFSSNQPSSVSAEVCRAEHATCIAFANAALAVCMSLATGLAAMCVKICMIPGVGVISCLACWAGVVAIGAHCASEYRKLREACDRELARCLAGVSSTPVVVVK